MDNFASENVIGEGRVGVKGNNDHVLSGHFQAIDKGRWDSLSWNKNDVGNYSKPFRDRHGFRSMYIRFKGGKTSRLVPEAVFRKFFEPTGKSGPTNPKKWQRSDQGGQKVKEGPRSSKRPLTRDEIEGERSRVLKQKETKKESASNMENHTAKSLIEKSGAAQAEFAIRKQGDLYVLWKKQHGMEFRVTSNKDIAKIRTRMDAMKNRAASKLIKTKNDDDSDKDDEKPASNDTHTSKSQKGDQKKGPSAGATAPAKKDSAHPAKK